MQMKVSCWRGAFGLLVISKLKHDKMSTSPRVSSMPKRSVSFASSDSRRSSQALGSEVLYSFSNQLYRRSIDPPFTASIFSNSQVSLGSLMTRQRIARRLW